MNTPSLGTSLPRLEDPRLLTGAATYVDDLTPPGLLHAAILRSPHAHATIIAIDTAAARATQGVHGVFIAADLAPDAPGPIPCTAQVATVAPMIVPPRFALAADRVRHVGDPVAFVVADTPAAAREAAERIDITYDPLPAVTDVQAALGPDAPRLHAEAPGNLAYRFRKGDRAAVAAAFAAAAHSVTLDLVNPRLIVAPLETRGAIAIPDPLHLIVSGASVHGLRDTLAGIFHLSPDQLRVSAPDVGGGFGVKNSVYPEYVLLLWAARRLKRPIKWIAERAEDFVSTAQGRDNITTARLALDADGRFLAIDVETIANLGAYVAGFGPGTSTNAPATAMGGPYDIQAVFMDVRGVLTNTVPIDAYRGAGKPEANYLTERLIEAAARTLNRDPFALRRANLIATFPYRNALGTTIDSGDFIANLDAAEAQADRPGFPARREAAAARGRLRGQGVACYLETSRGQPNEAAALRFDPDGTIALVVGTQSTGMGHETAYTQIASAAARPAARRVPLCPGRHRVRSAPAAATAAHAPCTWAARRWCARSRRCSPRPARWPRGCCRKRPTPWPTPTAPSAPRTAAPSPWRSSPPTRTAPSRSIPKRTISATRSPSPPAATSRKSRSIRTPARSSWTAIWRWTISGA